MGNSSGSSGGGGNNNRPRASISQPPVYQDRIIRQSPKARSYVATENKINEITRKQISNPNRMKGSEDKKAITSTVAIKPGNYVTDSKGMPVRTKSGSVVLTSKGKKEVDNAMRRIPLSKAQYESQKKVSNIISLPLMLVPGGGLIRAGIKNKQQNTVFEGGKNIPTYGGKSLISKDEANIIERQRLENLNNKPMPEVDLSKRKRKSVLSTIFEPFGKLGSGGLL